MSFFSGNNSIIATTQNNQSVIVAAGPNTANMLSCASWDNLSGNTTTVGSNGGPSSYGMYDMNGNAWEWTDGTASASSQKPVRGGGYGNNASFLISTYRSLINPWFASTSFGLFGFRISTPNNTLSFHNYIKITDINNAADISSYGSVTYSYYINKYMVTVCEYAEFLNAVGSTDTYGLYSGNMANNRCGLIRSGSNGSYTYSIRSSYSNKPIVWVSWLNAARYCNWLTNNKPNGLQTSSTTENGSYTLNGLTSGSAVSRNINGLYFIPSENEWYKAAYYKGRDSGEYWNYATQSDTAPTCIVSDINGNGPIASSYLCNSN